MSSINVSTIALSSVQTQEVTEPVIAPKTRRIWSVAEKLKILGELDVLKGQQADIGSYLRRNGLFSSTVSDWRKMRKNGILAHPNTKRGPPPKRTLDQLENERLNHENEKLQRELTLAKKLINIQKKVAAMLEDTD